MPVLRTDESTNARVISSPPVRSSKKLRCDTPSSKNKIGNMILEILLVLGDPLVQKSWTRNAYQRHIGAQGGAHGITYFTSQGNMYRNVKQNVTLWSSSNAMFAVLCRDHTNELRYKTFLKKQVAHRSRFCTRKVHAEHIALQKDCGSILR